jgi:hypothetical protein
MTKTWKNMLIIAALLAPWMVQAELWPGNVPVIEPQEDGVIVLNAEAAAFRIWKTDSLAIMNATNPQIVLEEGILKNIGREQQVPAWRFLSTHPGVYQVFAVVDMDETLPQQLRFWLNGPARGRPEKWLEPSAPGTGPQLIYMGQQPLREGEYSLIVEIPDRGYMGTARIQEIRFVPGARGPEDPNVREAAKRPVPKVVYAFTPVPPEERTIYARGDLDKLPAGPGLPEGKVTEIVVPEHPDAEARRRAFEQRNNPEGLAALSRRLQNALVPGTPGLEAFEQAMAKGRHAEALDAYRAYFFKKLKHPFGDAEDRFMSGAWLQSGGKKMFLDRPHPDRLDALMKGQVYTQQGRNQVRVVLGEPGAVNWAPADLDPDWKVSGGLIEFLRKVNRLPDDNGRLPYNDLLNGYVVTGDARYLERYAAYIEDMAMHSNKDIDNSPTNIRAAHELLVLGLYLIRLRVALDERPEMASDYPAPALARLALYITETYWPYIVRAKRAELANWGIMGNHIMLHETRILREFRSMQYANREAIRLARMNMIQHLSLDGAGLEAWDEGHMGIDAMLRHSASSSLFGAPVMGDLEEQSFLDHCKVFQRSLLTHFSPEGQYWTPWLSREEESRVTLNGKTLDRSYIPDLLGEPEARRRISGALAQETADPRPPRSDIMPYAFLSYTRDGFGPDMAAAIMQNFPFRSQGQGWAINTRRGHTYGSQRTQYTISRDGRSLGQGSAIFVERRPPDRWVDATPTGGKTDYSFKTPRNVQPGRFYTSDAFDFVETEQDSPYRQYKDMLDYRKSEPGDPIRDVTAVRQLIQLRDAGIFLIGDRVNNPAPDREFAKFFILPVHAVPLLGNTARNQPSLEQNMERLEALAARGLTLFDVDAGQRRLRTGSPGLLNTTVYLAGQDMAFGGVLDGNGEFVAVESLTASNLLERTRAAKNPGQFLQQQSYQTVSARWTGSGPQAHVTVMVTRDTRGEDADPFADDIEGFQDISADGAAGCVFRTRDGLDVAYKVSPEGARRLKAGPVEAMADTLFFTLNREEGIMRGIVLGGNEVSINGRRHRARDAGDAFTFTLTRDRAFTASPVHRPIDTTIISPQQTVFTDHVDVTFDIPTQDTGDIEFRYTLDGSDPTPQSALYTGPVRITEDTRVKVRPFRKGVTETLWTTAGVDAGKTMWAIYRKQAPKPATTGAAAKPGLAYQYFEGPWPELMAHSGMYPYFTPVAEGRVAGLLDEDEVAAIRQTDRAYQVKYSGTLTVPATGVYRFFAPPHLYDTDLDAGYDLRVWVDGEEWFPNPDLHAENIWSVALEKGAHRFEVSYTDYRWKEFRNEYWMGWYEEQMWQGTPVLELEGPGVKRQPVPPSWLSTM